MEDQLRTLISQVLGIDPDKVQPQLRRAETGNWDSLTHLRLMAILEAHFGVTLGMDDIARLQTPAEIQEAIERSRRAP
jgi:acyl carrier protein